MCLACTLSPKDACGSAAYQFASAGIAPCALNTSAAVGTSISITFTVFDYGAPSLSSSVSRTLLIVAPCPSGQFYCSGTCLQISCAASAALAAAAVTPVITLTSTAAALFGGTTGGATQVPYGTVPGFSLMPCTSYGRWYAPQAACVPGLVAQLVSLNPLYGCPLSDKLACSAWLDELHGLCILDADVAAVGFTTTMQ